MRKVILLLSVTIYTNSITADLSYPIVGTGTIQFWGNSSTITEPQTGESFYGQEPQFNLTQSSYTNNGDGTITDNVTGLMWTKTPDINNDGIIDYDDKISYDNAPNVADSISVGGYDDWRVPSIKEIYSLMSFAGKDPSGWNGSDVSLLTPFIDDSYFDVGFGDESAGERIIDGQYVTSSKYVSTTMNGSETMFGLNLVDGRIKGYPTVSSKLYYAYFVRGNEEYGLNRFGDNGDGTVIDSATGLLWQQRDSDTALNWEESFDWVASKNSLNYLGYSDWRLPTIKELQSLLDYSRSPATHGTAAIDPLFSCTEITVEDGTTRDFPFYWSSTTHENMNNGNNGAYMCFGTAYGWMNGTNFTDVHGAGAQRSDPKDGDPADYPEGHGPQGDVIRIYNYVRLVRNVPDSLGINGISQINENSIRTYWMLSEQKLKLHLTNSQDVKILLYTLNGRLVEEIFTGNLTAGSSIININSLIISSGIYVMNIQGENFSKAQFIIFK